MPHTHVSDADVRLFVSGRLDGPALTAFLRQVLGGCAECRSRLAPYGPLLDDEEPEPPETPGELAAEYDGVLDRALAGLDRHVVQWTEERADFERLMARAREEPFEGSLEIFEDLMEEVHGWAWVEAILALAFELRYRDPQRMRFLIWGATWAIQHIGKEEIDRGRYTSAQLSDLQARTFVELANAERLIHQYHEAENALAEAAEALEKGTRDPMIVGRLLDVEASLRMDERKLDEALDLLEKLHLHYLSLGETHLAGRSLIKKGIALARDERPQEAVRVLEKGLLMLDSARDRSLAVSARFDLIRSMTLCGDFREASRLLIESGLRQAFADDHLNLLKLRWLEGQIFAGLGKLRRAEEILFEVKENFLVQERDYLVAMVGLELASVLLWQGRTAEVEALAEEALELFQELGVEREALRAVRYLRDACRQGAATAGLIRQTVSFLNRLEHQPGLCFVP